MSGPRGGWNRGGRPGGGDDNCAFFLKVGACRHGDACTRRHDRPRSSQVVLVPGIYQNPVLRVKEGEKRDRRKEEDDFDQFFIDVFEEVQKFGEVDQLVVVDNASNHMLGNVYIKYLAPEDAEECVKGLDGRYYQGSLCKPELSPVRDFSYHQSRCRQFDQGRCDRGDACNFMHVIRVPTILEDALDADQPYKGHRSRRVRERSRSPNYDDDGGRYKKSRQNR